MSMNIPNTPFPQQSLHDSDVMHRVLIYRQAVFSLQLADSMTYYLDVLLQCACYNPLLYSVTSQA